MIIEYYQEDIIPGLLKKILILLKKINRLKDTQQRLIYVQYPNKIKLKKEIKTVNNEVIILFLSELILKINKVKIRYINILG